MSEARRQRRERERHSQALASLLGDFYDFLMRKDKPSDAEVRGEFIGTQRKWVSYCVRHGLPDQYKNEFNRQISLTWNQRSKEGQA